MIKYTEEELNKILEDHKLWLTDRTTGKRADLSGANLENVNLTLANLSNADLRHANLRYADLRDANLNFAGLEGADLICANLIDTDLRYANLENADLGDTNLSGANLSYTRLMNANLSDTNLSDANLKRANLRGANLSGANLENANLVGTIGNMREIKSIEMSRYAITYTKDIIQIGCQNHSIEEWSKWRDNKAWIEKMDEGALDWAEINLDSLLKTVKTNPAT